MPALPAPGKSALFEPTITSSTPSPFTSPAALTETPLLSLFAAPRMRNPTIDGMEIFPVVS